jgi:hypothetical protein
MFLLLMVFLLSVGGIAQDNPPFDFQSVRQLKIQRGLPDPFIGSDGSRIARKAEWEGQKLYIKAMLAHYQYGHMPPAPEDPIVVETRSEAYLNGRALRKTYTMTIFRKGQSLDLHFGLIKPRGSGPFPVIIKNDRSINDIPDQINLEAIERGYIMCQFVRTDLGTDSGNLEADKATGVFPLYPEYDWGTIAAWAWGYRLLIDFFEGSGFVDMNKIVVTGHSRGGKTAYCAGIYDDRIAITAPNSSGLGGTASHRYFELGMNEQTIGHASIMNPHWWTAEYFKLAGFENRVPFDAHFGKAVIAPRAFFNAHAMQDYWANPFGTHLTHEAARRVYEWLGVEDHIKMHWRTGGHAQGKEDWIALLDFCDFHFFKKEVDSRFDIDPYPTIKIPVFWEPPIN